MPFSTQGVEFGMAGGNGSDVTDSEEDNNNNNHYYTSSLIPKLQFRKASSKAYWREELCMFEVVECKGQMWTTTGVIRGGKIFCYIEEILFMAEMGGVRVFLDENEKTRLSLKDMYEMVESTGDSSSLHSFLAYKYLKSLGYVLIPPSAPWVTKTGQSCGDMWRMTACTSSRSCGRSWGDQSCGDMWKNSTTDDAGSAGSQSQADTWRTSNVDATTGNVGNEDQLSGDTWQIVATDDAAISTVVDNDNQSWADTWRTATVDVITSTVGDADQLSGDTWQIVATDDAAISTVDNDNQSWIDTWRIVVTDISASCGATKTVGNESQSCSDTCKNTATDTLADSSQSCEDRCKTPTQSHSDKWTTIDTGDVTKTVGNESQSCSDTCKNTAADTLADSSQSCEDRWKTATQSHGDRWTTIDDVTKTVCKNTATGTASQSQGDRWTTMGNHTCKTDKGESCGDTWRRDVGGGSQSDGDRWRMWSKPVRPIYKVFLPDGRFRKSCPGEPAFILCLCTQQHPPPVYSTRDIEKAEALFPGVPLKLCRVDSGHLSFFSFYNSPLPLLP